MPIRHRTLIAAAALLAAFSSVLIAGRSAARADYVYTFEGLTLTSGTTALGIAAPPPPPPVLDGAEDFSAMSLDAAQTDNFIEPPAPNLRGQDGWSSWTHTIGGIPYFQDTTVRSGIGINTTTVVGNPVNATNGNTDALTSSNASGILYRRNDANWSFTPFAGTETNATMQFDLTLPSAPFFPGGNGVKFGLGRYTSDDITVAGDQWGPVFGIENLNGGQRFYVRAAGVGKTVSHADPTAGAEYTSSFLANTVGSAGDWFQLQLVMDFTANSGSGAGTLYYRNLSQGQTEFTAAAGLIGVDLKLSMFGNPAPNTWDTMFLRVDSNLNTDNTNGPGGTTSYSLADNLVPNALASSSVVPEPGSLVLLLLGGIGWAIIARTRAIRE